MSMAEKFLGSSEEMTTMEGGRCYAGWQIGKIRQTTIVSIHNFIESIHHLTITVLQSETLTTYIISVLSKYLRYRGIHPPGNRTAGGKNNSKKCTQV